MLIHIFRFIIISLSLYAFSEILTGVFIADQFSAFVFAFVVGLVTLIISPILALLGIIDILTLGILSWIAHAIIILIADSFLASVQISNFWWALILAALIALVEVLFNKFFIKPNRQK